jgi:hypothetical protein
MGCDPRGASVDKSFLQRLIICTVALLLATCIQQASLRPAAASDPEGSIRAIGAAIVKACPAAEADQGVKARDACADRLGKMAQLANVIETKGLLWGGTINSSFNPTTDNLTRLDGFVWRKLYLSLFSFTGYSVDTLPNGDNLLRIDARIRPIAPEEYPYPFWHSATKWQDYQQSRQVGLLFRDNQLIAGYRNARLDPSIAFTPKVWDGKWTWNVGGQQGTRVALYNYSLSPGNPNRAALETAYRDLEAATRPYMCTGCHNPANPANMNPLVFFTHPSQALTARHEIVRRLETNTMPPDVGIPDENARKNLIVLAQRFAEVGDKALAYENGGVPAH